MAWQRKIPFGYRIENGKLVTHQTEATAVKRIYDRYLKGDSYLTIAMAMTDSGIRYHAATPEWNKHMVKRILENGKYAGLDGWPEIVSTDVYNFAVTVRKSKTEGWNEPPPCNKVIKHKLVCAHCGTSFKTQTSARDGIRWWHCGNEECKVMLRISDAELERRITALLNRLIFLPGLLDMQPVTAPRSLESERIQNELYRELGKTDWNEDYAKSLAFACAAERYEALGDMGCIKQKTVTLQTRLSSMAPLTVFDSGFFKEAADYIRADADGALALKLISGVIISENESGEVDHNADAVS
jgi:hypothetical protein